MNTDFSSLDKSDFKCLRTQDGAIYYGQCVQILPPDVETDKLAGFMPRDESMKPKVADSAVSEDGSSAGRDPLACLHQEGVSPLIVEDISQIDEELLPKLLTVRHGNGIQIQADKVTKYAG